jgi:hypothetical protein
MRSHRLRPEQLLVRDDAERIGRLRSSAARTANGLRCAWRRPPPHPPNRHHDRRRVNNTPSTKPFRSAGALHPVTVRYGPGKLTVVPVVRLDPALDIRPTNALSGWKPHRPADHHRWLQLRPN